MQRIGTIKRENSDEHGSRAVLLVDNIPLFTSAWCRHWWNAHRHGMRYAKDNNITVAYSD